MPLMAKLLGSTPSQPRTHILDGEIEGDRPRLDDHVVGLKKPIPRWDDLHCHVIKVDRSRKPK